jgi:hypothetical protein
VAEQEDPIRRRQISIRRPGQGKLYDSYFAACRPLSARQAALPGGHEKIVELLLSKGADVNAQGGLRGIALQAASFKGHEKLSSCSLAKGAGINAQGGLRDSTLRAASSEDHEKIIELLLRKGVNA